MWKTLGESLEAALASALNEGEAGAGTPADALSKLAKSPEAEAPGSFTGDTTLHTQQVHMHRERRVAPAAPAGMGSPSPAARRSLFTCIEGGGGQIGGGVRLTAAYRFKRGREGSGSASEYLKLVR